MDEKLSAIFSQCRNISAFCNINQVICDNPRYSQCIAKQIGPIDIVLTVLMVKHKHKQNPLYNQPLYPN